MCDRGRFVLGVVGAVVFLIAVALSAHAQETTQKTPGSFTKEELEKVYRDHLGKEEREILDRMSEKERLRYLTERASRISLQNYVADPLLRSAFAAYLDTTCPREKVIMLFEQYIAENPKSEFLPEVYFRIGALYSMHARENLKEDYRPDLAAKYFLKAHELYGNRFSYLNNTAWASAANDAGASLAFRREYYDWLRDMAENGTIDKLYPIREIQQTFNGRSPTMSNEDLQLMLDGLKNNLPGNIDVAEKNILGRAGNNYDQLAELAKAYPNTKLGKQAALRLNRLDVTGALKTMGNPSFDVPSDGRNRGAASPDKNGAKDKSSVAFVSRCWLLIAALAVCVLVGVALMAFRRPRAKKSD